MPFPFIIVPIQSFESVLTSYGMFFFVYSFDFMNFFDFI